MASTALTDRSHKRTPALEQDILSRLAKGEMSLAICRDVRIDPTTLYRWCDNDPDFKERYNAARTKGYDAIAQQCAAIAAGEHRTEVLDMLDDASIPKGVVNKKIRALAALGDPVARDKLRIETNLKLLAAWDHKRYGPRAQVEHSGSVEHKATDALAIASTVASALRGSRRDGGELSVAEPKPVRGRELPPVVIDQGDDLI